MNTVKKVKGGIFRTRAGNYFAAPGEGLVQERDDAYVFTKADVIKQRGHPNSSFGNKEHGTWELVYE